MEYIRQSSWAKFYEEGQTLQQIAETAGVSAMTVLRHLRTAGVETRTKGRRKAKGECLCGKDIGCDETGQLYKSSNSTGAGTGDA